MRHLDMVFARLRIFPEVSHLFYETDLPTIACPRISIQRFLHLARFLAPNDLITAPYFT